MAARRRRVSRKRRVTRKARRKVSRKRRTAKRKVVRRRRKARKSVRGSKLQVFRGSRVKTNGGLTKSDLTKNKMGRVVSKKKYNLGKKIYKRGLHKWTKAFMQARKNLGLKGFVACKKGTKFYKEAYRIFKKN